MADSIMGDRKHVQDDQSQENVEAELMNLGSGAALIKGYKVGKRSGFDPIDIDGEESRSDLNCERSRYIRRVDCGQAIPSPVPDLADNPMPRKANGRNAKSGPCFHLSAPRRAGTEEAPGRTHRRCNANPLHRSRHFATRRRPAARSANEITASARPKPLRDCLLSWNSCFSLRPQEGPSTKIDRRKRMERTRSIAIPNSSASEFTNEPM